MPAGPSASSSKGDEVYKNFDNNTHPQWWRDPGLRRLNLGIILTFTSATANGFDASLMNGLLAIPTFERDVVDKVSTNILGLIVAAISLGGLFALVPAAYFSDHFGRKKCLAVGTLAMITCSVVQTFTSGPWAFLATKLVLGAGIAFVLIPAPALSTEVAHPRLRGYITVFFQCSFYWGAIISAIATLAGLYVPNSWSWRMPVLLQCLFPALQLLGLFVIPESPRWLVANGKSEQAFDVLSKFHANGDRNDQLVQYEFREITEAIEAELALSRGSSWADFVSTKGNRHRLFICVMVGILIQWAGNGIVSYYLTPVLELVGIKSPTEQASINLGLQIWNAILALVGAYAAELYGRRPLWLISAIGMLVSFSIVTALSAVYAEQGNATAGKCVIAFLFIFFGFYDIAFTPLSFAYPTEILPYKLRSRGLSVTLSTIFAFGFFNQYVNPIALEALAWRFYFVYIGCLVCFIAIIYFFFPETQGRSLEEIAAVFDGPSAETEVHRNASIAASVLSEKLRQTTESEERLEKVS